MDTVTDKRIGVQLTEDSVKLLIKAMEEEMHRSLSDIVSMSERGDSCRHTFDQREEYIVHHIKERNKLKEEYEYMNVALKGFYSQRGLRAIQKANEEAKGNTVEATKVRRKNRSPHGRQSKHDSARGTTRTKQTGEGEA